ncbi:MAG: hypothetical protein QG673_775 [Pseudomonadota bacterium]|nr:hypothetical protein [Pseudomonadota bacterium]
MIPKTTKQTPKKFKQIANVWANDTNTSRKNFLINNPNGYLNKIELFFTKLFSKKPHTLDIFEKNVSTKILEALLTHQGWEAANTNSTNNSETKTKKIILDGDTYKLKKVIENKMCKITLHPNLESNSEKKTTSSLFAPQLECTILKCAENEFSSKLDMIHNSINGNTQLTILKYNMTPIIKLFKESRLDKLNNLFFILNSITEDPNINSNSNIQNLKKRYIQKLDSLPLDQQDEYLKFCILYKLALSNFNDNATNMVSHEVLANWRQVMDKALSENKNFQTINYISEAINNVLSYINKPENRLKFIKLCLETSKIKSDSVDKNLLSNQINSLLDNSTNQMELNKLVNQLATLGTLSALKNPCNQYLHCLEINIENIIPQIYNKLTIVEQTYILEYITANSFRDTLKTNNFSLSLDAKQFKEDITFIIDNMPKSYALNLIERLRFTLAQNLLIDAQKDLPPEIADIRNKYLGNAQAQENIKNGNFNYIDYSKETQVPTGQIPNFGDLHASGPKLLTQFKLLFPEKSGSVYKDMFKLCEEFQNKNLKYPNLSFIHHIGRVTHTTTERELFAENFRKMLENTFDVSAPLSKQDQELLARWMGDCLHDRNCGDLIVMLLFEFLDKHNVLYERHTGNHEMAQALRITGHDKNANIFAKPEHNSLPYTTSLIKMLKQFFLSQKSVLISYKKTGEFFSHSPFTIEQFISGCEKIGVAIPEILKKSISTQPIIKISPENMKLPIYLNDPLHILKIMQTLKNIPQNIPTTQDELKKFIECCTCLGIDYSDHFKMLNVDLTNQKIVDMLKELLISLNTAKQLTLIHPIVFKPKTLKDFIELGSLALSPFNLNDLPESFKKLAEYYKNNLDNQELKSLLNENISTNSEIDTLLKTHTDLSAQLKELLSNLKEDLQSKEFNDFVKHKLTSYKTIGVHHQFINLLKSLNLTVPDHLNLPNGCLDTSNKEFDEFLLKVKFQYEFKQFLKFCESLEIGVPEDLKNININKIDDTQRNTVTSLLQIAKIEYNKYLKSQEQAFIGLVKNVNEKYHQFITKLFNNPQIIISDEEIKGYENLLTIYKNNPTAGEDANKWLNDTTKQSMTEGFKFIKVHVSGHDSASQHQQFHRGNVSTDNSNYKILPILGTEPIYFTQKRKHQ